MPARNDEDFEPMFGLSHCLIRRFAADARPGSTALACVRPALHAAVLGLLLGCAPLFAADSDVLAHLALLEEQVMSHPEAALGRLAAADGDLARRSVAQRCQILTLRGRAEIHLGRFDDVRVTTARLDALGPPAEPGCARAGATLLRAQLAARTGESGTAQEHALEANRLATLLGDWPLAYWAADLLASDASARGDYDVALRLREQQAERARQNGDRRRAARAHSSLSDIHYVLGEADRAMTEAESAWRLAVQAKSPWAQAEAKLSEAAAAELKGDLARDRRALEQALGIAREAKSTHIERWVLINLADFHLRQGEYARTLEVSQRSLALAEAMQSQDDVASSSANVGFSLLLLGRADEGRDYADRAVAIYERQDRNAALARLLAEYGHYLELSGDARRAVAAYHRERALLAELARVREAKIQRGMKAFYESERQAQEVELLNRRNALQAVELDKQLLEQRLYAALAVVALLALVVVLQLYRRMRTTAQGLEASNRTLAATRDVDPLTGLFNRRHFHELMRGIADRDRRQQGAAGAPQNALLLLDLDHFKRINDRFGHAAGDAVLVEVARRVRASLRDDDRVVRWGGEEFLVWAALRPADHIHDLAGRVLDAIGGQPFVVDGGPIAVTTSIGYLAQPLPPDGLELSWRESFDLADMALYLAKAQGRNRGCGIAALRRAPDGGAPDIGHDLEAAAQAGKVDLHFLHGPRVEEPLAEATVAHG
ncbi:MAG: diguanylate cyclase [Betaproteobacteria bacterium]|nr:diguanylate cyclase [Betaproteobacteria bacterium]